jgi:hypothetical protein
MAGSRQNVDRRMVALDQRSAVAAQIFAVQAVDQRRCHPVGGQSSQPQIGVAEGAGHHTPRPVGFSGPRTLISIGFAEGLEPSDAHWGFAPNFPGGWAMMSRYSRLAVHHLAFEVSVP